MLRLADIVAALGGQLLGDPQREIHAIAPIERAGVQDISFCTHAKYQAQIASTQAACLIVPPVLAQAALARGDCIVSEQAYVYYARLSALFKPSVAQTAGVHPSAVVAADAVVHPSARIGPLCVVERGARIGAGTVLASRVTVGRDCVLGARCIVHSGAVIGADGFGFAHDASSGTTEGSGGHWVKIEQLGAVHIGDDVEIGANTCIDRGALSDTVIEDGVKLDNLIQIGHNVRIGKHSALAGCVGVAGSASIGAHCTVGGGAVVLGHLRIADHVNISASTTVTRSISKPGTYTGVFPIDENAQWEKNAVTLKQLSALRERIRELEKSLKK